MSLSCRFAFQQVQLPPKTATASAFPGLELAMKDSADIRRPAKYANDADYFFAMVFPAYRRNVFAYYSNGLHSIEDRYSKEEIETFENFLLWAWKIAVANGFQHGSRKFGVGKLQAACRLACRNHGANSLLPRGMASMYHKQTLGC